jgi:hypothetical protein
VLRVRPSYNAVEEVVERVVDVHLFHAGSSQSCPGFRRGPKLDIASCLQQRVRDLARPLEAVFHAKGTTPEVWF